VRLALAFVAALVLAAPAQAAVKVTWPPQRAYAPGERIAVKVKADRKVRVTVVRVSASGKLMSVLKRRALTRGRVAAKLTRPGTYEVRVGRSKRTYGVVARPPACDPVPDVILQASLSADRVQRGQNLPFTVKNVSDGCIWTGVGYGLEYHQGDGAFKPVPWPLVFPAIAVLMQQGEERADSIHIPADAPLGTYRLVGYTGFTEPTFEVVA